MLGSHKVSKMAVNINMAFAIKFCMGGGLWIVFNFEKKGILGYPWSFHLFGIYILNSMQREQSIIVNNFSISTYIGTLIL